MTESGFSIKLIWIPSHRGIPGNKMADSYAKKAIRQGIDTQLKIPSNDFHLFWKTNLISDFNSWCIQSSSTKGASYFKHYFLANKRPWFWNFNIPRKTLVSINRIRSGHTSPFCGRSLLFRL